MAKVTLTIEDIDDGEGVKLTLDSDPPFDMADSDGNTDAQISGLFAMSELKLACNEGDGS